MVAQRSVVLDLSLEQDRKEFLDLPLRSKSPSKLSLMKLLQKCNILDFCKGEDTNYVLKYKDVQILFKPRFSLREITLINSNEFYFVYKNRIHQTYISFWAFQDLLGDSCVNCKKSIKPQDFLKIVEKKVGSLYHDCAIICNGTIVLDGDKGRIPAASTFAPTCSFDCLQRFYEDEVPVVDKLLSGQLRLLDSTTDQSIALTKAEKKVKEVANLIPPEKGFSVVGWGTNRKWHQSGTVLLYDKVHKWYLLVGQDEGTYFGVQLQGKPKTNTVLAAFEDLIPTPVKEKPYVRQGEWFIIAADPPPDHKDCILGFLVGGEVFLPLETSDSNQHRIFTYDGRVDKNGKIYALNPSLHHDEHQTVSMKGWCTFYKNTAVRSFSQEGVD